MFLAFSYRDLSDSISGAIDLKAIDLFCLRLYIGEQHVRLTSLLLRRFSKGLLGGKQSNYQMAGSYLSMIWSSGMMFVNLRRIGICNLQS